ncbi:glycosyltransferase involved in cell wall biosynthesis [Hoeflea marina]|uniref:Glycosyltransferase involved in cell wall biosynthesis n=1 Tax=Hoeflea marina TaxID=274592 RepID=A0A317PRT4_9HYPH|nr:hypothetical protein [Hoeflea marina]PWW04178.1 glycosyltransferase involved in cell wall biosynthesis [Hoeflea marina]
MKTVFLVSAPETSHCGVGNYTAQLAAAFAGTGVEAVVEYLRPWSLQSILGIRRKYAGSQDVVFHVQYPSLHMGNSLSPALLPLLLPDVFVTLHEFRLFSLPRKLIFLSHAALARRIIFSSDQERDLFARWFPFSKDRLSVIPIGNNIVPLFPHVPCGSRLRLVYFGQIARGKGIEDFVATARRIRAADWPADISMIGALLEDHADIAALVRDAEAGLGVTLHLNLPSADVSRLLAEADVAYLPFPDGVTDKRGSAIACLAHGAGLLTTHTQITPAWLRAVSHSAESPDQAFDLLDRIRDGRLAAQPDSRRLAGEIAARGWHAIAGRHGELYRAPRK